MVGLLPLVPVFAEPCLCLFRSYIYQKRWVRLDADYLRYFDSNKVKAPSVPHLTFAPTQAWAEPQYCFRQSP